MTDTLFTPFHLGDVTLPSRVAMAPMTRNRSPGGVPTDLNALYYGQRATAGLIITEGTTPDAGGRGYIDIPGLYNAAQVAGWRQVTDAVHAKGGRIFAQLMHTGRISHPDFLDGGTPVAPSAVGGQGRHRDHRRPQADAGAPRAGRGGNPGGHRDLRPCRDARP